MKVIARLKPAEEIIKRFPNNEMSLNGEDVLFLLTNGNTELEFDVSNVYKKETYYFNSGSRIAFIKQDLQDIVELFTTDKLINSIINELVSEKAKLLERISNLERELYMYEHLK